MVLALLAGCGTSRAAASRSRVATRTLAAARGADRPLPTTLWYPARLDGRHPIVLFSHGLGGLPEHFTPLVTQWAAAGYIVAAPAYPHTNAHVRVDRADIAEQPADAAYVIGRIRALGSTKGDVLAGHVDGGRVAAVGFSAGGTTTLGLLRPGHDPAIRAAVSIAGREPSAPMGGAPVATLFVHGDRDPVVPIAAGRQAYASVPWPGKRFVSVPGGGHGQYLNPGDSAYARTTDEMRAFLVAELGAPAS